MHTIQAVRRWTLGGVAALAAAALVTVPSAAHSSGAPAGPQAAKPSSGTGVAPYSGLTATQRARLMRIAEDSWRFFADDVDPQTHLPLDNLTYAGGSATPTS